MDDPLREWLAELDIDEASVKKFAQEDLTLNDVLSLMTRADLSKLRLKLGPELRIWDKISKSREEGKH